MADIAVVGCGPKAVALAAKAAVLSREGYSAPNIVIFERDRAASAWRGSGGYTDGIQPLCTLAERDLGFPYSRASFGSGAAQTMYADYSWQAYAVAQGVDRAQYDQWVLRGRNPPAHDEFARYLLYALNRAGVHPVTREVTSLDYDSASQRWLVESKDAVAATQIDPFDGVVITGSGPALPPLEVHLPNGIVTHGNPRVFDGITFWKNLAKVEQILAAEKPSDRSVVIVGAGGTAAAIAYWFVRRKLDARIAILGREATLYARHPGYFEDRMFSEEADWAELSAGSRNEFVSRLTSGVVWDYVLRNLDEAEISYLSAQVHHFEVLSGGNAGLLPEVQVHSHPPVPRGAPWTQPMDRREGAVFIDARGFDRWDFVSRLSPTLQSHFQDRTAVEAGVTHSLMVGQTALPTAFPLGLHCPMLASFQGPASSNLMALGWMADRILNFYVQKPVSLPSLSGIALPSP